MTRQLSGSELLSGTVAHSVDTSLYHKQPGIWQPWGCTAQCQHIPTAVFLMYSGVFPKTKAAQQLQIIHFENMIITTSCQKDRTSTSHPGFWFSQPSSTSELEVKAKQDKITKYSQPKRNFFSSERLRVILTFTSKSPKLSPNILQSSDRNHNNT